MKKSIWIYLMVIFLGGIFIWDSNVEATSSMVIGLDSITWNINDGKSFDIKYTVSGNTGFTQMNFNNVKKSFQNNGLAINSVKPGNLISDRNLDYDNSYSSVDIISSSVISGDGVLMIFNVSVADTGSYSFRIGPSSVKNGTTTLSNVSVSTTTLKITNSENVSDVKKNGWNKEGAKWYYYDDKGEKSIGWKRINGSYYYFDTNGVMQTGWINEGGAWYYLTSEGRMYTGWLQTSGKWYYLSASGRMLSGWSKIDGQWYYFSLSGEMVVGWRKINNIWYFFNSNGYMATGWEKISNYWYYFNLDGSMRTGWLLEGTSWYYMKDSGEMACNTNLRITNKTYSFNASGICINP